MIDSRRFPAYALLALAMMFYCLDYYFRIAPSLVVTPLMLQYQTSPLGIGGFASAFYLGYLLFQIPAGILLDNHSLRLCLVTSIVACVVAFVAFFFLHHYSTGYVLRLIVGATSAFSFIAVLTIAKHHFQAKYFNIIAGITISVGTLVAALIQYVSAQLLHRFIAQDVLIVIGLFGLVIAALLMIMPMPKFDYIKKRRTSTEKINALLREPRFILNALLGGLMYLPTSILAAVWGISFITNHYYVDEAYASIGIFSLFLGWCVGAPLHSYISRRVSNVNLWMGSMSFLAMGLILLLTYETNTVGHLFPHVLFTVGLVSSAQVLVWDRVGKAVIDAQSGVAIALTNVIMTLCSALFHPLLGFLFASKELTPGVIHFCHGIWVLPMLFLISSLLAFGMGVKNTARQAQAT